MLFRNDAAQALIFHGFIFNIHFIERPPLMQLAKKILIRENVFLKILNITIFFIFNVQKAIYFTR